MLILICLNYNIKNQINKAADVVDKYMIIGLFYFKCAKLVENRLKISFSF